MIDGYRSMEECYQNLDENTPEASTVRTIPRAFAALKALHAAGIECELESISSPNIVSFRIGSVTEFEGFSTGLQL